MSAAFDREDGPETQRLVDLYVAMVAGYANNHVETARGFFLPMLCSFLLRIDRKRPMPVDAGEQLADDLITDLEAAATIARLVDAFRSGFWRLQEISRPVRGPKILRVDAAVSRLRRDFTSRMSLSEVARKAGFSLPAFVKIFRERTGTSFLPFVRSLRVEYARRLLIDTDMTSDEVASASGFHSVLRMNRAFRIVTGATPERRPSPPPITSDDIR
ncbi:MAG TPA: AraC family transcriptional regulator [Polyangia bacterium]|nr:AraC family transcriptional regulator [Polyangia bacterium]